MKIPEKFKPKLTSTQIPIQSASTSTCNLDKPQYFKT